MSNDSYITLQITVKTVEMKRKGTEIIKKIIKKIFNLNLL